MCCPTCKGAAYLAVSIFVYRAVMVIITMISSSITRRKSSYLPLSVMEELLLQLIYFIPLFTSSCFILIGLESNSFTYMFYSTLSLTFTLFLRYVGEISYIYAQNWDALKDKLPQLYLHLAVDTCLIFILFLYARNRLRCKERDKDLLKNSKDIYHEEMGGETLIHNDLKENPGVTTPLLGPGSNIIAPANYNKNVNVPAEKSGNGETGDSLTYYHYPPIRRIDSARGKKPLPPLPLKDGGELDDVSLIPPPVPLAGPDSDDDDD